MCRAVVKHCLKSSELTAALSCFTNIKLTDSWSILEWLDLDPAAFIHFIMRCSWHVVITITKALCAFESLWRY